MLELIARSISSWLNLTIRIISPQKVEVYYSPEETNQNKDSAKLESNLE
jgi:hypothetical protein